MKRFGFSSFTILGIVVLALAMSATTAMADNLSVWVSNGTSTFTCADNAACDGNSLVGAISFTNNFGTFSLGAQGSNIGLGPFGLDLSFQVTGAPGDLYQIMVSENDMTGSNLTWVGQISSNSNNSVTTRYMVHAASSNVLFDMPTSSILCNISSTGTTDNTTCTAGPFTGTNFSLTDMVRITIPAGTTATVTGDALLTSVPEPGSLIMLTSGLIGLVSLRRRKLAA